MKDIDLLISIENSAECITAAIGEDVVKSVLNKYDASSVEEVDSSYFAEVFNELYAIEVSFRD